MTRQLISPMLPGQQAMPLPEHKTRAVIASHRAFYKPYREMHHTARKSSEIRRKSGSKSHLLALPAETRATICTILLVSCDIIRPNVKALYASVKSREELDVSFLTFPQEQVLAIARTCTAIRDEVLPIYFGSNRFMFEDTWDMYAYLYMIGDRRTLLKHLSFVYHGSSRKEAFELLSECASLRALHVMVLNDTMKGARWPKDDLFQALGMRALRSIRGLVGCKITVKEVVATRTGGWANPKLVISLNTSERRRFSANNISDVERVLNEEISKEEGESEVILEKEPEVIGKEDGSGLSVKKDRGELKWIKRDICRVKEERGPDA